MKTAEWAHWHMDAKDDYEEHFDLVKSCIEECRKEMIKAIREIIPTQVVSYIPRNGAWKIEDARFEVLDQVIAVLEKLGKEDEK